MTIASPRLALLLSLLIGASGCAGTSTRVANAYLFSAEDRFKFEVQERVPVTDAGLSVFMSELDLQQDSLTIDNEAPTRRVLIEFVHYRVRSGATRVTAGIFAGTDKIITITTIRDAATDELLGQAEHTTGNATAVVGTNGLLQGHAQKIIAFVRGG